MKINKILLSTAAIIGLSFVGTSSFACESDEMLETDSGFIFKVVAGSDKISAFTDESASEVAYKMELLQPYFVICDAGDYYKITDLPADSVDQALSGNVGFVAKDQTYNWTTREALSFSEIAFLEDRPEITAWDDEAVLAKFMETGNKKLHPPAFKENLDATRLRERSTRPYPVLGSDMRSLRGVTEKRVYNVLLPAALTPTAKIEIKEGDVKNAEAALSTASILVVFDATGSMDEFALQTAKAITGGLSSLPKDVREGSEMGFLFYRDEGDEEKLVPVAAMPLHEAANALEKAAGFMAGGGDVSEPILDAMYYASNIFDWAQSGKKIVVAVLNGDAKIKTIGSLDSEGRIPAGLDAYNIAKDFYDQSINIISVQAGPDAGANLANVLGTLSDETGGMFIPFASGKTEKEIASALITKMSNDAADAIKEGKNALGKMAFDLNGFATIPLEVLKGETLERLRAAGVDFNIDTGEGGVLIREGYVLENDDLLSPEIQIEKETLINLINLYSVLATVGVDEEAMVQSMSEAIAAISGEEYDSSEPIEEVIEKKLGIQFRSDLLNFDLNFLAAMVPNERLAMTKRIETASEKLNHFFEANQDDFDTRPAVWMPIAVLP